MIIVRSPLRVSFFGGGTDYEKWFLKNKGAFLSTAIDKYVFSLVKHTINLSDFRYRISWKIVEEVSNYNQIQQPIVRETIKYLKFDRPAEFFYLADVPALSGLGSSASYAVATIKAISSIQKKKLSKSEVAKISYEIEKQKLNENTGIQDAIAASYGGLNFVEISKNGKYKVNKCLVNNKQKENFFNRIVLVFTGIQRSSSDQAALTLKEMDKKEKHFRDLYCMAFEGRNLLLSNELDKFGNLLDESWKIKSSLNKNMSNTKIDNLYEFSKSEGALGMKILGAGGGGFAAIFLKKGFKRKFLEKIKNHKFMEIKIDEVGAKLINFS